MRTNIEVVKGTS